MPSMGTVCDARQCIIKGFTISRSSDDRGAAAPFSGYARGERYVRVPAPSPRPRGMGVLSVLVLIVRLVLLKRFSG